MKLEIPTLKHQRDFIQSKETHTALIGGFGCFLNGQKIIVNDNNLQKIEDIKIGHLVKSFNLETKEVEIKKVLNTFKYSVDSFFKIKMKDGTEINVTKNHKFLYENNWISIEKILSLFIEIQEVDNKK